MTLSEIILAVTLSLSSHTLGHIEEGNRLNVDVGLHVTSLTEHWSSDDRKKRLRINGAGFRAQDAIALFTDNDNVHLVNGLYKLGYLVNMTDMIGISTEGDINLIAKDLGESRYIKGSLLLSALADIHKFKNPDRRWNLILWQSKDGVPGLAYTLKVI